VLIAKKKKKQKKNNLSKPKEEELLVPKTQKRTLSEIKSTDIVEEKRVRVDEPQRFEEVILSKAPQPPTFKAPVASKRHSDPAASANSTLPEDFFDESQEPKGSAAPSVESAPDLNKEWDNFQEIITETIEKVETAENEGNDEGEEGKTREDEDIFQIK
jgi:hypothetical protein